MAIDKKIFLPEFDENDPDWLSFYNIFRNTLNPGLPFRIFKAYLFFKDPVDIDVSFIYDEDDEDLDEPIGFVSTAFYRHEFAGRNITIARGAAGVLPQKRGGMLPSFSLCKKYMHYKLRHPWERVYITGYMANPILYSMMCKYTHLVYPKATVKESLLIEGLKSYILESKHRVGRHLVQLHFKVSLCAADRHRIEESQDRDVRYFLSLNPGFGESLGLFTIIPLSWWNIMASLCRALKRSLLSKWKRSFLPKGLINNTPAPSILSKKLQ